MYYYVQRYYIEPYGSYVKRTFRSSWIIANVLWLGMNAAAITRLVSAEELTPKDVIEALESSIASVSSFDVYIDVTRHTMAEAVRSHDYANQPRVVWKAKRSQPVTSFSRLVMHSDGRCRFERLNGSKTDCAELTVFTGKFTRQWSKPHNSGAVRTLDPDKSPFPDESENYAALFRDAFLGGRLVDLLRERREVQLYESPAEFPNCVTLEVPPQPGAYMYPSFGFELTLDLSRGFMPRRIDAYRGGLKTRFIRYDIEEHLQLSSGGWVPIRATVYQGPAELIRQVTQIAVDRSRSQWNTPLQDNLFVLKYPAGTKVVDQTRDITLIAGDGDPGTNIDMLVANSKVLLSRPGRRTVPHKSPQHLRYWLIAGNFVIIAMLLMWYYRRRHI